MISEVQNIVAQMFMFSKINKTEALNRGLGLSLQNHFLFSARRFRFDLYARLEVTNLPAGAKGSPSIMSSMVFEN